MASTSSMEEGSIRATDFCNSFWGVGDSGVNVLLERMQNATKTTEELRDYWDQRAIIEAEYSARLGKLAHRTLGTHEIGDLQTALHTLNITTTALARTHASLAQQIRNTLYEPTCALLTRQKVHRDTYESDILQRLKVKKKTEAYVTKAREKYESDWIRINSYTAQLAHSPSISTISSTSSGTSSSPPTTSANIQRLKTKLARARETVAANEHDYQSFLRDLEDLMPRWEADWKGFCDACQDLEEERGEVFREWMWGYANAVSSGCVSDDQSCESLRLALDVLEPQNEVDAFAREFGTGGLMEVPPPFSSPEETDGTNNARQNSSTRPATKEARYVRMSTRIKEGESRPVYRDSIDSAGPVSPPGASITAVLASLQEQTAAAAAANSGHPNKTTASNRGSHENDYPTPSSMDPQSHGSSSAHRPTPSKGSIAESRKVSPPPPFDLGQPPHHNAPVYTETRPETRPSRAPSRSGRSLPSRTSQGQPALPSSSITEAGFNQGGGQVNSNVTVGGGGGGGDVSSDSEGRKFLFYVKAIYDYTASTSEEFDFQAGDVIAVIDTPDDGWWTGELLDEQRRVQGQNIFPSNFVELF